MPDTDGNKQDFKPIVLDPDKRPAKPAEGEANKVPPATESTPQAKPEAEKAA